MLLRLGMEANYNFKSKNLAMLALSIRMTEALVKTGLCF